MRTPTKNAQSCENEKFFVKTLVKKGKRVYSAFGNQMNTWKEKGEDDLEYRKETHK